jgi:hypothetical protein
VTQKNLQAKLLTTLRASGKTKPSALVDRVSKATSASKREVEEALHVLVDRRQVSLTWHGELEADQSDRS